MVQTRASPGTATPARSSGSTANSRASTAASTSATNPTSVARRPNAATTRPTLTPLPPAVTTARAGRSTLPGRSSGRRTVRSTARLGVAISKRRSSLPAVRLVPAGWQGGRDRVERDPLRPRPSVPPDDVVQGAQPLAGPGQCAAALGLRQVAHRVAPHRTPGDVPARTGACGDLHLGGEVLVPGAFTQQDPRHA